MAKCLHCNKLIESKGTKPKKYCNDVCRMRMKRDIAQANEQTNTNIQTNTNKRTDLEQCRYCGVDLPRLSRPRQHPGACYPCAIAQPSKPKDNSLSSQPVRHTTHRLTVMERLFYRPANELGKGEHNFVSLPGRACYGVH